MFLLISPPSSSSIQPLASPWPQGLVPIALLPFVPAQALVPGTSPALITMSRQASTLPIARPRLMGFLHRSIHNSLHSTSLSHFVPLLGYVSGVLILHDFQCYLPVPVVDLPFALSLLMLMNFLAPNELRFCAPSVLFVLLKPPESTHSRCRIRNSYLR